MLQPPPRSLAIVGTDTGIGKTLVAGAILHILKERVSVCPFKPAETGCSPTSPPDGLFLRAAAGLDHLPISDIVPNCFSLPASPLVSASQQGLSLRLNQILEQHDRLSSRFDFLVIEGAGGLLVPYGPDWTFADLLEQIRPALIEEMAGNPLVADYFDLSLQHTAVSLLRAMKRPGSGEQHRDLIARIRRAAPDAALRSSFIVGFPGETDDDVVDLAAFLSEVELDWAGFFPYSPEEGTEAAVMDGQIPEGEKQERLRYLQAIQDEITTSRTIEQIGRTVTVVVDQVEEGMPVGRSYREAPEIDGVIILDHGEPGEWVTAEVTGGFGTDLEAVVRGPA